MGIEGMSGARALVCHVCGEPLTDTNSAVCNTCGNAFHLRLRNARLDGEATTREDEEHLARQLIAEGDKARHPTKKPAPSRSS